MIGSNISLVKKIKSGSYDRDFLLMNFNDVIHTLGISNKFNQDKELVIDFILICIEKKLGKRGYSLIDEIEDLDKKRFIEYLDYREENKSDSFSDKFFFLKYGNKADEKKNNRKKGRSSCYEPKYIMKKYNLSMEEAETFIENYKKNKSTSKEGFIKRHGKDKGIELFNKFKKTSVISIDNLSNKYGKELGKEKYLEWLNGSRKRSCWCIEYWLERGFSKEESKNKVKEFMKNNSGTSLTFLKRKFNNTEEEFMLEYEKINKKKDGSSFSYFLKKVNGDKDKALLLYKESCKKKDSMSLEYFIKKGFEYEDALKLHNIEKEKRISYIKDNFFSKEATMFFDEIQTHFDSKFLYGKEEICLYDRENKRPFFYDFAQINDNDKKIVEYHGVAFHPKPTLTEEEKNNWSSPFSKEGFRVVYDKDQAKKELAISLGYKFLEVWSDDNHEYNVNKVITFLKGE